MQRALDEMARRRALQQAHNAEHDITPVSIKKSVAEVRFTTRVADVREPKRDKPAKVVAERRPDRETLLAALEEQMREAAAELDFELAAQLRDQIFDIRAAGDGNRRTPRGVDGRVAKGA